MFSVGRVPFEMQHERIFTTFYKGSTMRQTVAHIAFVRPDVAIVDTLTEVSGFGPLPPPIARHVGDGVIRTRLEQVMVRERGRWQVAAFHNVPIDAAAAAAGLAGRRRTAVTAALAVYVHWPFCVSKCPYCDFNSHVRAEIDEARLARRSARRPRA